MNSFFKKLFGFDKVQPPDFDARQLTRSEKMREALTYSESMLSKRFDPKVARLIEFEVCTPNILVMTSELIKHNATMNAGKGIKPLDVVVEFNNTNLEKFFTDSVSGTYISQLAYRHFHEEAKLFCEFVHQSSLEEFGRLEHNYRMLRPVIHSVTEICLAIGKAVNTK